MEDKDITSVLEIDRKLNGVQRATTHIEPADEVLGSELNLSFAAEAGGQYVGFILARIARGEEPAADTVPNRIMGVDLAYQRRGVATAPVNTPVKTCRSRDLKAVRLMRSGRDSQLHSFCQRLDFRRGEYIQYTKTL